MYITVHAAAGAAISQFSQNQLLVFILAVFSHFFLDTIPHGDEWIKDWKLFKKQSHRTIVAGFIDFLCVAIISIFWIRWTEIENISSLAAGIAGAIAPDALWGFHSITQSPVLEWYRRLHTRIHKIFFKKRISPKAGFLLQGILLAIFSLIIAKF